VLRAIVDEAHAHGLPVTAHWGSPDDLDDVLAAGVDGLEHTEPRGVLDGWPEETLAVLVERDISLTPTLAVTDVVLPARTARVLRQRAGEFHAAGGRVVAGSDAGMPGVPFGGGLHRELRLLVEGGLTPREALKAATSKAAGVLGSDDIGVIEPGRAADLLVVDGDPLQRIQAVDAVVLVLRDGRIVVDNRG
jgi:enamidase